MIKRIFAVSLALLTSAGLVFTGCESVNGPEAAVDDSQTVAESFDITALSSQASLLSSAGVNTDSANAFFMLRWSQGLGHFQTGDEVRGHASAVAYEQPTTLRDRDAVGLDMGNVSVANGANQYDLPKLETTLFGVRYGMFGGPGDGKGPHGGGPRDGHGGPHGRPGIGPRGEMGGHRDSLLAIVNIPFAGGAAYQFNVTGAGNIAARTLDIQAPSQLVQITGLADKDTIDATQDLTITWEGDATAGQTVLVLAPAFKRGRLGGPDQFVEPVFLSVNAAAGSYTITAQTLQDLLSASGATAFALHLSQAVVRELSDANLGKILISAGADDKVVLHVK